MVCSNPKRNQLKLKSFIFKMCFLAASRENTITSQSHCVTSQGEVDWYSTSSAVLSDSSFVVKPITLEWESVVSFRTVAQRTEMACPFTFSQMIGTGVIGRNKFVETHRKKWQRVCINVNKFFNFENARRR